MTIEQIADELGTAIVRVSFLRAEIKINCRAKADGTAEARSVTVRVNDPMGSGSASSVTVTSDDYAGIEAVRAELARQISANRRGTRSRIATERARS